MTTLRRHLWRWLTVAMLASLATAAAAPTTATAAPPLCSPSGVCPALPQCDVEWGQQGPSDCAITYLAPLRFVGWTYLNLNHCPQGMVCPQVFQQSTTAWRWTGTRWLQASLAGGWVYVYPYTGKWRWAWTQRSGWVAISGGRFEVRSY